MSVKRAARDMSDREFLAALKRNNFGKPILFWCEDKNNPGHSYGIVADTKGKLYKRATIAHLLASRAKTNTEKATPTLPSTGK